MSKPKTTPVDVPYRTDENMNAMQHEAEQQDEENNHQPQPLSGSKTVKNRNHSRSNHGEGS